MARREPRVLVLLRHRRLPLVRRHQRQAEGRAALSDERRTLGLPTATALVVANMIGFGVFTTSGYALADLGTPARVLAAWATAGAIAVLGAISYGALARRFRDSGGEYLFLSRTIHPLAGFLAGWISLLAGVTAPIAGAAAALEEYAGVPFSGTAAIVLAGLAHGARTRAGALAQNAIVLFKLLLLFGLLAVGLPALEPRQPSDVPPFSAGAFAVALVWISLSFSGWNATVYVGGEVRDPERTIPRSMLLGTAIVAAAYLLLNAMFVYAAPVDALSGQPDVAAIACRALGGETLERVVSLVVVVALFTSISAMVMAGPRVYAKMADDGLFPRAFESDATPRAAILLQVVGALVFLWVATLPELIGYIGWTLGLSTALTVVGLIRLRLREGPDRVPVPGWPWVPCTFVFVTVGAAAFMLVRGALEPFVGLGTIVLGAIVYAAVRHRR